MEHTNREGGLWVGVGETANPEYGNQYLITKARKAEKKENG